MRKHITAGVAATLVLVSSVTALSREEVSRPVVTFIDFYVASQKAEMPSMSLWERVLYGVAVAKAEGGRAAHGGCTEGHGARSFF